MLASTNRAEIIRAMPRVGLSWPVWAVGVMKALSRGYMFEGKPIIVKNH